MEGQGMTTAATQRRDAPIDLTPSQFRELGHRLIDQIADLLASLPDRPVTPGNSPEAIRRVVDSAAPLPEKGVDPRALLERAFTLLSENSLYNGHPRFWGYITASAAPLGILGDCLAAAINPNVGAWKLSPMATEMEAQAIRWIAELIGYPADCGGVMVSGGNMANFVGFLAARVAKAGQGIRTAGGSSDIGRGLRVYSSKEGHTWIQKAADLFGLGTDAIRWIATDREQRIDLKALEREIQKDKEAGLRPFLVIGSAGTVSTGAIDPLPQLAALCRAHDIWFHIDGAYAGVAAGVPGVHPDIKGLSSADSIAVDPHKWLYQPLEAGCALVRHPEALRNAFSYHPPYYRFDDEAINYVDYGLQNSRGFRALKVWLTLQQVGREGYLRMIGDDIALSRAMHDCLKQDPEIEVLTQNLSITTFRYVPEDLRASIGEPDTEKLLNKLNEDLLGYLQDGGEAFVSNAVLDGRYVMRACIVNFRTTLADVRALPSIVTRLGRESDRRLRTGAQTPSRV